MLAYPGQVPDMVADFADFTHQAASTTVCDSLLAPTDMPNLQPDWTAVFSAGRRRGYTDQRWKDHFGVTIAVVMLVWDALPADALAAAQLEPVHLLWLLHWFHDYRKWSQLADDWYVCERTFRTHVPHMLDVVHAHLRNIHLNNRFYSPPFGGNFPIWLVIDATVCPVSVNRKDWEHQKPFFSPRHAMHCLKYEIAVHWLTGRIFWVAGGVFGSIADLTLTRFSSLLQRLHPAEFILADKGYIGERALLCPFKGRTEQLDPQQRVWNKAMNPHRTIVENAFARLHRFKILSTPFRHQLRMHPMVFAVIAQIADLDICLHPLRRDLLELPHRHRFYVEPDRPERDPVGWVQRMRLGVVIA